MLLIHNDHRTRHAYMRARQNRDARHRVFKTSPHLRVNPEFCSKNISYLQFLRSRLQARPSSGLRTCQTEVEMKVTWPRGTMPDRSSLPALNDQATVDAQ